jgi:hypothetical protein
MSPDTKAEASLLQQSGNLRENIAKLESLESDEQIIRLWRPLREGLPEHVARLEALVNVVRFLHGGGLLPVGHSFASNEVKSLLKVLPDLRDKLLNNPDKVMQKSGWAKADIALRGATNALEQSLEDVWKKHLQNIAPKLEDWLPFFQLDRFGDEVRQIKALHEELQTLARRLPNSAEILERVEEKSRDIHRLVKKLDFGDIPLEVKKFINQVASFGGVPLSEVNETVLVWLREKGLAKGFRVNMGGR